ARGLFAVEAGVRRLPVPSFWEPVLGSLAFGLVGLLVPRALGVGYDAIQDVIDGRLAAGAVGALLVAKLVAWWLALGSGTSGGTLAPVLLVAGCFGHLVGAGVHELAPGLGLAPGACAVAAMAATFGAATGAPFAAIVFVFELTGDLAVVLPLMLATVAADLVARALMDETLMTEKLSRRGLRVRHHYEPDVFHTTTVRAVMRPALAGDAPRGLAVRADDPLVAALPHLADGTVEDVPVVDGAGNLVGACSRHDLLADRLEVLDHERPEPGWLARRRRRWPAASGTGRGDACPRRARRAHRRGLPPAPRAAGRAPEVPPLERAAGAGGRHHARPAPAAPRRAGPPRRAADAARHRRPPAAAPPQRRRAGRPGRGGRPRHPGGRPRRPATRAGRAHRSEEH